MDELGMNVINRAAVFRGKCVKSALLYRICWGYGVDCAGVTVFGHQFDLPLWFENPDEMVEFKAQSCAKKIGEEATTNPPAINLAMEDPKFLMFFDVFFKYF